MSSLTWELDQTRSLIEGSRRAQVAFQLGEEKGVSVKDSTVTNLDHANRETDQVPMNTTNNNCDDGVPMMKQANHQSTTHSCEGIHVVTPQSTPTSSTSDIVDDGTFISSFHGYHQEIIPSSRGDTMMSAMGEREKGSLGIYRSIQEGTHFDRHGLSTYTPSQLIVDHCAVTTTTLKEEPNQCYVPYLNPDWLWELTN